jgi:hypothetical protein
MNYLQLPTAILPHLRRLSAVQLAIWADAWTWAQQGGKAYRTNEQLAEMFGTSAKSVSRSIAGMREMGMVQWQMANGRQRILVACIPTNVHPHERPSTPTSIHMNGDAASTSTSTLHPHERPGSIHMNVHQVNQIVDQEVYQVVDQKAESKKRKAERVVHDVVLPFDTDTFRAAWAQWKGYKAAQHRFTFKGADTEQIALHQLQKISNNNERTAIEIIGTSIANGWKGLFAGTNRTKMGARPGTSGYVPEGNSESTDPFAIIKDSSIWG